MWGAMQRAICKVFRQNAAPLTLGNPAGLPLISRSGSPELSAVGKGYPGG